MAGRTGLLDERIKTDIRLAKRLNKDVDETTHSLGLSKNTFFSLAAIRLLTDLVPYVAQSKTKKRQQILQNLRDHFQKLIDAADGAA